MKTIKLILVLAVCFTSGCSSKFRISNFDPETINAGDSVDGIPFRVPVRYDIKLYQKRGDSYVVVFEDIQTLIDPDRFFLLDFKSGIFSDATTAVVINENGTLSEVSLTSSNQSDEILTALSSQSKALADAKVAVESGQKTKLEAQQDLEIAALEARQVVELAVVKLETLAPDATPADIVAAENDLELAIARANLAATRAGLPLPFTGD